MQRKAHEKVKRADDAIVITCPFCFRESEPFKWDLSGLGKSCECGAVHRQWGITEKDRP